jgi:Arc/MetJ family transcription regulator
LGKEEVITTSLDIDKNLLEEALKIGKHKNKKDTVNEALKEYVMRRKRRDILSLFGKVEMETSYDYWKERNAR